MKFYSEEDHILQANSLLNITGAIKLRNVMWTGHVAWIGKINKYTKYHLGKLKQKINSTTGA
jgi:hypothetical protein